MKSVYRIVVLAVLGVSIGVAGYSVVKGDCAIDCDDDTCLIYDHDYLNTLYLIDTREDQYGVDQECFLEFFRDPSDDYYGSGNAGYGYCKYRDDGTPSSQGCGSQTNEYYEVDTFYCTGLQWDGDWVFVCFEQCNAP